MLDEAVDAVVRDVVVRDVVEGPVEVEVELCNVVDVLVDREELVATVVEPVDEVPDVVEGDVDVDVAVVVPKPGQSPCTVMVPPMSWPQCTWHEYG